MKLKFANQYLSTTFTFAVGVNQTELTDFPDVQAQDAILIREIGMVLDAASAAPSTTGAGLTNLQVAIVGKSQSSPTNLTELESIIFLSAFSIGATSAGPIYVSNSLSGNTSVFQPVDFLIPAASGVYCFGQTANVTNAATTVIRLGLKYDVVTLTVGELAALL